MRDALDHFREAGGAGEEDPKLTEVLAELIAKKTAKNHSTEPTKHPQPAGDIDVDKIEQTKSPAPSEPPQRRIRIEARKALTTAQAGGGKTTYPQPL